MSYRLVITDGGGLIESNLIRRLLDVDPDIRPGNMALLTRSGNSGWERSRSAWVDALAGTIRWPVERPDWWRAVRERNRQRGLKPAEAMTAAPVAVGGRRS